MASNYESNSPTVRCRNCGMLLDAYTYQSHVCSQIPVDDAGNGGENRKPRERPTSLKPKRRSELKESSDSKNRSNGGDGSHRHRRERSDRDRDRSDRGGERSDRDRSHRSGSEKRPDRDRDRSQKSEHRERSDRDRERGERSDKDRSDRDREKRRTRAKSRDARGNKSSERSERDRERPERQRSKSEKSRNEEDFGRSNEAPQQPAYQRHQQDQSNQFDEMLSDLMNEISVKPDREQNQQPQNPQHQHLLQKPIQNSPKPNAAQLPYQPPSNVPLPPNPSELQQQPRNTPQNQGINSPQLQRNNQIPYSPRLQNQPLNSAGQYGGIPGSPAMGSQALPQYKGTPQQQHQQLPPNSPYQGGATNPYGYQQDEYDNYGGQQAPPPRNNYGQQQQQQTPMQQFGSPPSGNTGFNNYDNRQQPDRNYFPPQPGYDQQGNYNPDPNAKAGNGYGNQPTRQNSGNNNYDPRAGHEGKDASRQNSQNKSVFEKGMFDEPTRQNSQNRGNFDEPTRQNSQNGKGGMMFDDGPTRQGSQKGYENKQVVEARQGDLSRQNSQGGYAPDIQRQNSQQGQGGQVQGQPGGYGQQQRNNSQRQYEEPPVQRQNSQRQYDQQAPVPPPPNQNQNMNEPMGLPPAIPPAQQQPPPGVEICGGCKREITDEEYDDVFEIETLNNLYHVDCFRCCVCQTVFDDEHPYIPHNGQAYCEPHYDEMVFQPVCFLCNQAVFGQPVYALGKAWHPEHLTCASCQKPIQGNLFEHNNQVYCAADYTRLVAPTCRTCRKAIQGETICAMGNTYHRQCFVCSHPSCRKGFENKSFYVYDGEPYCRIHYHECNNSLCGECRQPIEGPCAEVADLEKRYHPECWICHACHTPLTGTYYSYNQKPYCEDDIMRVYQQHKGSGGGNPNKRLTLIKNI